MSTRSDLIAEYAHYKRNPTNDRAGRLAWFAMLDAGFPAPGTELSHSERQRRMNAEFAIQYEVNGRWVDTGCYATRAKDLIHWAMQDVRYRGGKVRIMRRDGKRAVRVFQNRTPK